MTSYVILCRKRSDVDEANPLWWEYATDVEASSATEAIRKAVTDDFSFGEFVAIPLRSWHPLAVERKQISRLVFGQ